MKTVIINMAPHLPMEGRKNTPYTIEESGTLSHPDAGLNEESLENSSNWIWTWYLLVASSVPQIQMREEDIFYETYPSRSRIDK